MSRELEILSRCLKELRRSEEHGPHSKAIIRDVYIQALIMLCEDLLLRTVAQEAESPDALDKAIRRAEAALRDRGGTTSERAVKRSDEEMQENG